VRDSGHCAHPRSLNRVTDHEVCDSIDLLFEVIDVDDIRFGSEMVGAVRGIDPRTGHHVHDPRRYVAAVGLAPGDRATVFELDARRVYPRLDATLAARGR
jgi:4-oxalmesaconate hydratase